MVEVGRENNPFVKGETVRTNDSRIGKIDGYEDGRFIVLFEDGSRKPFLERSLTRVQILKG